MDTMQDDALRTLWDARPILTREAICERLGIHRSRLGRMVTRLGLPARGYPETRAPKSVAPKRSRSKAAKEAYEARATTLRELWAVEPPLLHADIAERLAVTREALKGMVRRLGLKSRQPIVQRPPPVDFRAPRKPIIVTDATDNSAAIAAFLAARSVTRDGERAIDVDAVMNTIRRHDRVVVPAKMGEFKIFLVDGKRFGRDDLLALANRYRERSGLVPWQASDVTWKRVNDQADTMARIKTMPGKFRAGAVAKAVREGRLSE
jgi:hypothetical protein